MNKTEAAEFLGVSVRALERYTAQNRVGARYEKGKTRSVLIYDQGELERFKTELETATHRPSVERRDAPSQNTPNSDNAANAMAAFGDVQAMSAVLSPFLQLAQAAQDATSALQGLSSTNGKPGEKRATPTEAKLLLTVEEAQSLTGLSRGSLMDAIRANQLAARKVGRAWRIKRRDLEAFVDAL